MGQPSDVRDAIATFSPHDGNWLPLEDLLAALWEDGVGPDDLPLLLGLFERFPEDDGGVLWSVLHGIEALPVDYEDALRASLRRAPSSMVSIMVGRLERAREKARSET